MPAPGVTGPFDIRHGDMHLENVLFSDINLRDPEHTLSPLSKVSCGSNAHISMGESEKV